MKIVIVSSGFYPDVHPRAFRSSELAKELSRKGHDVTAVFFRSHKEFDYAQYGKENGLSLVPLNVFSSTRVAEVASQRKTICFKVKRFFIDYFLDGYFFKYSRQICCSFMNLSCIQEAELIITLSTPFSIHYGLYQYMKKKGKHCYTIADSGDPYYFSHQSKKAFWFKYIEKNVYKYYDFITIPTVNAINQYSPVCPKEKIKIIPQGFDMTNLNLYQGEFGNPVKFAYAGVFYWDIRNPEFLFKILDKQDVEYEFHIFMRYADRTFVETLERYPNLKKKVKLRISVPHDELIYELSRMDFLINIENLSNTQMPSKLIDYGMVNRPILSCNETNYREGQIVNFLNGIYEGRLEVNISDYDIKHIANQFLSLVNN